MSIVNEALKKVTKEERWVPQAERRKFTFSAKHLTRNRIVKISILSIFFLLAISFVVKNLMPSLLSKNSSMVNKVNTRISGKSANQLKENPIDKIDKKYESQRILEETSRLNQQGLELYRAKRFNEAKETFSRAINIKPGYATAYNNLGLIFMEEGNEKEAEIKYRSALKVNPNYPEALNNLGLLYAKQGNYDEAIRLYQSALNIKPDYPDAHLNLAILLERSGYIVEAKKHYNSFIEDAPKENRTAISKVRKHLVNLS